MNGHICIDEQHKPEEVVDLGEEGQTEKLPVVYFPLDMFPIRKKARVMFKFVLFWELEDMRRKHRVNLSPYTDKNGAEWLRWFVEDNVTYVEGIVLFQVVGLSWFCDLVKSDIYKGIVRSQLEYE